MVRLAGSVAAAAAIFTTAVIAGDYVFTKDCGTGLGNCPSSKPCCSQYGQCGIGAFCLGGCDPLFSFNLQSCMPRPQCSSKEYSFDTIDRIAPKTQYLGDPEKYDFVADGNPVTQDGELYLTMAKGTVGTVLATTRYVWYGKITAVMKTSRGQGVVSSFILMSDVKDEIDYEWVGVDLAQSQTNYYWNGVEDYRNGANISMGNADTFSEYHTYTIDWTPEQITWSVDGQVGRTKKRSETWNATAGKFMYPQTPSRVQLSLWPGGLSTNGKGTIDWAGGLIGWDTEDVKNYGYYYAVIKSVSVDCYDPPAGHGSGTLSYEYTDLNALNTSVSLSNKPYKLGSFGASGNNPNYVPAALKSVTVVSTATNAAGKPSVVTQTVLPSATDDVETVPGMSGAGFGTGDLGRGGDDGTSAATSDGGDSSGSSSSGSGSGSGSGSSGGSSGSTVNGFTQAGASNQGSGAINVQPEHAMQGSMLAVIIAFVAMVAL